MKGIPLNWIHVIIYMKVLTTQHPNEQFSEWTTDKIVSISQWGNVSGFVTSHSKNVSI